MVQKNICVQYGTGVEEQNAVKRSGKIFCSEAMLRLLQTDQKTNTAVAARR